MMRLAQRSSALKSRQRVVKTDACATLQKRSNHTMTTLTITPLDIWNEFAYYRKRGHHETAYEFIRPHRNKSRWEVVIAMLVHHRYPGKIHIGDTVNVGNMLVFKWDEQLDSLSSLDSTEGNALIFEMDNPIIEPSS